MSSCRAAPEGLGDLKKKKKKEFSEDDQKNSRKKNKPQRQNPERNLYLKSKTNLWIKENPRREKTGAHTSMVTGQSPCQTAVNPTEMLRAPCWLLWRPESD